MRSMLFNIVILVTLIANTQLTLASIDQEKAVRAIIGEAEDQGDLGMLAVAEAIRNRGTLKGVLGLQSPRIRRAKPITWRKARVAWEKSRNTNTVRNASHWENVNAFGEPSWAKDMRKVIVVRDHVFYEKL